MARSASSPVAPPASADAVPAELVPLLLADLPVLTHMGRSIFDPIWAQCFHVDPRSELVHVLRGQVRIETPSYSITGREGDTLYVPAGLSHRDVFPAGTVFEVYLAHFDFAGEKPLLERATPGQLAQAGQAQRALLAQQFEQLYRDFLSEQPLQRQLCNLGLAQILCRLCQGALQSGGAPASEENPRQQRRRQIMALAREAIARRCHQPVSLEELAEAVGVSPYYLSRVFSQESGFTLSSYLTRVRMEKAAQLLQQRGQSVKSVAHAVGFRDSHYFARVFRGYYHVAPSLYRGPARAK